MTRARKAWIKLQKGLVVLEASQLSLPSTRSLEYINRSAAAIRLRFGTVMATKDDGIGIVKAKVNNLGIDNANINFNTTPSGRVHC